MKYTVAFLALFLISFSGNAMAQFTPYDSLAVDSVLSDPGVSDPENIEGPPNSTVATLTSSSFLGVQFFAGSQPVTFVKGDTMHVYWLRLNPTDSAAVDIYFGNTNTAHATYTPIRIMENAPSIITLHETSIIVPDTGFNALSIEIGADTGASICWIDAIELMQSGIAAVGEQVPNERPILAAYPNPIEHGSDGNIEISSPAAGRGELAVFDVLGREIERVPIGELSMGQSESVSVQLDHAGAFFARLLIDGVPAGEPLKLLVE